MKPRVYIETTIPSYLTAWSTNNLVRTACQQITRDWWAVRDRFDLFVSPAVARECRGGDPTAAAARIAVIRDLEVLDETAEASELARILVNRLRLPKRAEVDALHIALSAVHRLDFLLTWNCTHMANAMLASRIADCCIAFGCRPPIICTPYMLLPREEDHG
jgi:hypothetical protein